MTVDEVIQYMVVNAQVQSDGSGIFVGTPRPLWETKTSVSSGPKYRALYDAGLVRQGRGRSAKWIIPVTVMRAYGGYAVTGPSVEDEQTLVDEMPQVRLKKSREEKKA